MATIELWRTRKRNRRSSNSVSHGSRFIGTNGFGISKQEKGTLCRGIPLDIYMDGTKERERVKERIDVHESSETIKEWGDRRQGSKENSEA
jgi:hypothetical protein